MIDDSPFLYLQYVNQSAATPASLSVLILSLGVILGARQSWAIGAALLSLLVFVAPSQRFVILGVDFPFFRIGIFALVARAAAAGRLTTGDRFGFSLFAALAAWLAVCGFARQGLGYSAAFVAAGAERIATILVGVAYFGSAEGVKQLGTAARVILPVAFTVSVMEYYSGRNPMALFGALAEQAAVREGSVRVQGAFGHPIIFGVFWAMILPIAVAKGKLATRERDSVHAVILYSAICASLVLVSGSSTGVGGLVVVAIGFLAFRQRSVFPQFVQILGVLLLIIHFTAGGGAHGFLYGNLSLVAGSTGYHRTLLLNEFANHFFEWALLGTESTAHWGHGLSDVTCEYVLAGVQGGIVALSILIVACWYLIRKLFLLARRSRDRQCPEYCAFVAIVSVVVMFFGVSLFEEAAALFAILVGMAIGMIGSEKQSLRNVGRGRVLLNYDTAARERLN